MEIWGKIADWFESTHLHQQILEVDYVGLFTNPWFIVPFGLVIVYMLFKQQWKDIFIIALFVGIWWVSGTDYMKSVLVDGEIRIEKILPVVGGGAAVLALLLYLLLGRSD